MTSVLVNGRRYAAPRTRAAVVCADGLDPRYLDDALERNLVPRLRELSEQGVYARGRSQLPSLTNGPERPLALALLPEGRGQQRKRRGRGERGTESLNGARGEQRPGRAGQARRQRGERKDGEAGHERAAAAVEITCAPADQQERAERERVGGHDPLQVRSRGAEIAFDGRQGDRHDHAVEHYEQVGGAQQRQHRAARRGHHRFTSLLSADAFGCLRT
jgi:hypothetical protein